MIIINEELPLNTIECIENYLEDKYDVIDEVSANPGECLTEEQLESLVGWYDGDSAGVSYNKWFDKSGLKNDGLVDGTGFEVFDGQDTTNEFYINNHSVVLGTTDTEITFEPSMSAEVPLCLEP